jgi:hypothetical protein
MQINAFLKGVFMKNKREEFNVIFKGDIESIDSEILIANLVTTSHIIQEINKEIGGKEIEISIKAFAPGSFEIAYIIAHVALVSGLFNIITGTNVQTLKMILDMLGDILKLKKFLGGKKPIDSTDKGEKIQLKNSNGNIIIVDKRSYNIYSQSPSVNEEINKGFKNLEKNEEITGYQIIRKDGKDIFLAERAEFKGLYAPNEFIEENKQIKIINNAKLSIFKIVFEKGYKWTFIYEGQKINAHISDEDFYKNMNLYEFKDGDYFDATLKITQVYDSKYRTYINSDYEVTKINQHIKVPRDQRLPFG